MTRLRAKVQWHSRTLLACVAGALPLTLAVVALHSTPHERGRKLFYGGAALSGRLAGDDEMLPAEAVRCANCHALDPARGSGPDAGITEPGLRDTLAPALGHPFLTSARRRRGGPPSSYTRDTFCRALRDGVDPAHVTLPKTMPRFTLLEGDCTKLWTYLAAN